MTIDYTIYLLFRVKNDISSHDVKHMMYYDTLRDNVFVDTIKPFDYCDIEE